MLCWSGGQTGRYVSETECEIIVKPGDHEALAKAVICLK